MAYKCRAIVELEKIRFLARLGGLEHLVLHQFYPMFQQRLLLLESAIREGIGQHFALATVAGIVGSDEAVDVVHRLVVELGILVQAFLGEAVDVLEGGGTGVRELFGTGANDGAVFSVQGRGVEVVLAGVGHDGCRQNGDGVEFGAWVL